MKSIITIGCMLMAFCSNALSLTVQKAANKASVNNNSGYASARSSVTMNYRVYDIIIKLTKFDKGKYVLFAMSYALVSVSNGGTKTDRVYVWIPDSFKQIDLGKEEKQVFTYTTPKTTFEKEKWEYIGDYSKGAKLNGVVIGVADVSTKSRKIIKVFKDFSGAAPKTLDEVESRASNEKNKSMLDDLGYFDMSSCVIESIADGKTNESNMSDEKNQTETSVSLATYIVPKMFKASMPKMQPVKYLCKCEIDDYYSYEFGDCQKTHWSVDIKVYKKDGSDYERFHGYVLKSSELGRKISSILSDGEEHEMTLDIRYTAKAKNSDIVEIVGTY